MKSEYSQLRSWVRTVITGLMINHVKLADVYGDPNVRLRTSKDQSKVTLEIEMRRNPHLDSKLPRRLKTYARLVNEDDVFTCNEILETYLPVLGCGEFALDTEARTKSLHKLLKETGTPKELLVGSLLVFKVDLSLVDRSKCEGLEFAGRHTRNGVLLPTKERRASIAASIHVIAERGLRTGNLTATESEVLVNFAARLKAAPAPIPF